MTTATQSTESPTTLDDVAEAIASTVLSKRRDIGYLNDKPAQPSEWWYDLASLELDHELTAEERTALVDGVNAHIVKLLPIHAAL
jgi:hypothetical protein